MLMMNDITSLSVTAAARTPPDIFICKAAYIHQMRSFLFDALSPGEYSYYEAEAGLLLGYLSVFWKTTPEIERRISERVDVRGMSRADGSPGRLGTFRLVATRSYKPFITRKEC